MANQAEMLKKKKSNPSSPFADSSLHMHLVVSSVPGKTNLHPGPGHVAVSMAELNSLHKVPFHHLDLVNELWSAVNLKDQ